jgi:uncharacterized Fe-S cluster-containing protein
MAVWKNATTKIQDTVTAFSTLYTAETATIVHAVYISNNSVGSNADIVFQVLDDSAESTITLLDNVPLRANMTLVLEKPINLETGDSIRVKSSTGCPITVFASVMEI